MHELQTAEISSILDQTYGKILHRVKVHDGCSCDLTDYRRTHILYSVKYYYMYTFVSIQYHDLITTSEL